MAGKERREGGVMWRGGKGDGVEGKEEGGEVEGNGGRRKDMIAKEQGRARERNGKKESREGGSYRGRREKE